MHRAPNSCTLGVADTGCPAAAGPEAVPARSDPKVGASAALPHAALPRAWIRGSGRWQPGKRWQRDRQERRAT